jgi:chemotaxis protein methyltransferase CheR
LDSIEQYAESFFSAANGEEREYFINAITTNKTDFFREPEHFDYLRDVVLPAAAPAMIRERRRFHAWSAGCSSGEEPYTLAMVLAEYAHLHEGFDFAILGTDISTRVLAIARGAIYPEAVLAPAPLSLRRKYLLRSRGGDEPLVRIGPALRKKVSFHQLNFMDADYAIKDIFDVIFFRNVMIYFDRETQQTVINRMCRNLAPGGYLFAGHSESLTGLNIPLTAVKTAIYRKDL